MSSCTNLFAIHYFLWFSAITSIYGYVSVYAEHYANASSTQYGTLNMVLPFVTIGSKVLFCSLADRHRAYRTFFIIFLISALVGYGSFAVMPFFVNPQPKTSGVNSVYFAIICLMTSIGTISMSVISCLSDAFAMNSAKKHNSSYGSIRVWGTLGWAASAGVLAFINQTDKLPLLVPGLLMTIVLLLVDIITVSTWQHRDDFELDKSACDLNIEEVVSTNTVQRPSDYGATGGTNLTSSMIAITSDTNETRRIEIASVQMQWILFKQVALRRRSLFRFMLLFTISGALISLQWSYFFLYLNQIYTNDFSYISGLSMVGQSLLGELPFFLLSQKIVSTLGRSHTLSISIASIGIRYLLYEYLLPNSSMYFVLVTETFQGPNFGLFYVVMTEVGLDYSECERAIKYVVESGMISNEANEIVKLRQALRATMQSVMSACYEGLGLGIGSILGGLAIDHFGFAHLWFYSALTAFTLGFANLIVDLTGCLKSFDNYNDNTDSRRKNELTLKTET